MWALRTVMLLALIIWIGGIIFFAFVLAPTLFTVLHSPQVAGDVVGPALTKLHCMGMVSGAVFLVCSLLYGRIHYARFRLFTAANLLIVVMLLLTAISQFSITPRMRELRSSYMNSVSAHAEFDRLHAWSTRLEATVLVLGLVLVIVTARRLGNSS